ncbi:Crp/Fnr family transcriptional regulator [Occallatibacter riparius]|uniref:Crp/Fnr family transcriptional regulator n=1 Tax=Occallatibacter riparius TaxID=1002689 RepID=A0A9J7BNZ1_9BACT|nr:Crp/Fnr family transcriptional regulator [Occallatibacter riparius]UWZ82638.1 Crp/Fnr family transcriptional regulator [Occallatibacter riparius]
MANVPRTQFRNRILNRLSESNPEVLSRLTALDLPLSMVLRGPGGEDGQIYFIEEGMASATALSSQGSSIEVGLIGREGLVGVGSVLGHPGLPHQTLMQVAGRGFSMPTDLFRVEFAKPGPVMAAVHDFLYAQLIQASQAALCNRLHPTEPRLAKWLLNTSDIVESNTLQLTQEFLAQMIGAERSSATIAAGALKRAGLIDYQRGLVEIINRPMLEDAACECYATVRAEFAAIFGGDHASVG